MHAEGLGYCPVTLACAQSLKRLSLLMVTELGRPFCRCPEFEWPVQPSKAAFELTAWQVRPIL